MNCCMNKKLQIQQPQLIDEGFSFVIWFGKILILALKLIFKEDIPKVRQLKNQLKSQFLMHQYRFGFQMLG